MNPSQQNATDQTANFFWMLVLLMGIVLATWWLFPRVIVHPIYMLRYYELDLIKWILELWSPIASFLHLGKPPVKAIEHLQQYILHVHAKRVLFDDFSRINVYVGDYVRYPTMLILFSLAVVVHYRHASIKYRSSYTMRQLKKQESENWPQIAPTLSLNLVKTDPDKGPWAMAKTPLQFCKTHNIVRPKSTSSGQRVWDVDEAPTHHLFSLQVGSIWKGVHNLPIHVQALIAVFIARAHHDRDIAKKILSQIAASATSGKLDFSDVDALVIKYQSSNLITWLEKRHAYVYTLVASLLEIARSDGVLASSEFLWLKPVDRRLWYVLNSVGRQTCVIEVAGAFSHWKAEKKLGRALRSPMVKEAVVGLKLAMSETLCVEKGDKWRISNAA